MCEYVKMCICGCVVDAWLIRGDFTDVVVRTTYLGTLRYRIEVQIHVRAHVIAHNLVIFHPVCRLRIGLVLAIYPPSKIKKRSIV